MTDITVLLRAAGQGDGEAADRLFALLYGDLRRLARSRLRNSGEMTLLDTTALVHESFLRFRHVGALDFPDRDHFLAYAARVMRAVVVDMVRARQAQRRGSGQSQEVTLEVEVVDAAARQHDQEVLRVHEALADLASVEPRLAQVVELRYFGGLSEAEAAAVLGVTERTVQRDWQKARLFLSLALK
jgi:RNA polymerase sigma factor (TIGR02999 family)